MLRTSAGRSGTPATRGRRPVRAGLAVGLGLAVAASLVTVAPAAVGAQEVPQEGIQNPPGGPGVGDPYFPMDGNEGYDVSHYGLELSYDPGTDVLEGVATIDLQAKHALSRFNFDFDGLTVDSITVDGTPATFVRRNGELKITPAAAFEEGQEAQTVVTYHGVPVALPPEEGGGVIPTDDGVIVMGQPHVASTWFPANDHPSDTASYDIAVTVPEGLEAVSNGALVSHDSADGQTRWVWSAPAPMATYLATIQVGEFNLAEYHADGARPGGIDYVDAIDPDLVAGVAPHNGTQFALSQRGQQTYKRLSRTIAVPEGGATLSFWVNRDTEPSWDHVLVEARTVGQNDWTTLTDANGHTTHATGSSCPFWLGMHPFLTHYQTPRPTAQGCRPRGTTGSWQAATGTSDGWEQWSVDLGAFSGATARVSISYVSDDSVQASGVAVDDIEVSTGEGTTSFEDDGDTMDGWTVPGAPAGSRANVNDWIIGTADDAPGPLGTTAQASLDRQPEILAFLAARFGDYPFADSGAIIDDQRNLGFALENQTRPVYAPEFFGDQESGDSVIVHELAHQWFGDRMALTRWKNIWLNEGFATYAEWLWSEHEGHGSAQSIFNGLYSVPEGVGLWELEIGNPGPDALFAGPVYDRGAMTLHALRMEVGSTDFFEILRRWAASPSTRRSTTANFIGLAERVSGQQLDGLFRAWLHTTHKPALTEAAAALVGPPAEGTPPVWPERGPATAR